MSIKAINQVISRAIADPAFKSLLYNQPEDALKDYELSEEEIAALRSLPPDEFEAMAANLEERIARKIWLPANFR